MHLLYQLLCFCFVQHSLAAYKQWPELDTLYCNLFLESEALIKLWCCDMLFRWWIDHQPCFFISLTQLGKWSVSSFLELAHSAKHLWCGKHFLDKTASMSKALNYAWTGLNRLTASSPASDCTYICCGFMPSYISCSTTFKTAKFVNPPHRSSANWEQRGVWPGEIWMCCHEQCWNSLLRSCQSLRER